MTNSREQLTCARKKYFATAEEAQRRGHGSYVCRVCGGYHATSGGISALKKLGNEDAGTARKLALAHRYQRRRERHDHEED